MVLLELEPKFGTQNSYNMLNKLPADVLENNVFFYLKGQDLYNLYLLNKEMRTRLYPVQILTKLRLRPYEFWPRLCLDFKGEYDRKYRGEPTYALAIDSREVQELLPQLSTIQWTFPAMEVNSPSLPHLYKYLPKATAFEVYAMNKDNSNELAICFAQNNITELNVASTEKISEERMEQILSNLSNMTRLGKLQFVCKVNPAFAHSLQKYLPGTNIKELDFQYHMMNDEYLSILASALPDTKIKSLNLYGNFIMDSGVEALAAALPRTVIESIDLGRNQITRSGVNALAEAIPNCKLKSLELTENQIEEEDMDEIFKVIHMSNFESFVFYDDVSNEGQEILINHLPKTKIKDITIGISTELIGDFMKAAANSPLEKLHLRTHDGDQAAITIAENIEYFKLKSINLCYAKMTATGFGKLIQALEKTSLEELDVGDNPVGNKGLKLLAEHLPQTQIKKLILNRCKFSDEGVLALKNCLHKTKLVHLEMRSYDTTGPAVLDFLNALNKSMRYLEISWSKDLDRDACAKMVSKYPHMTILY
ncbi:hypothetical protein HDV06_001528 [Boothiomyces sp. JEL0866]|nr:hypothetical protein HDV06_001528 [Boothiomyces sp. JEL0866]